MLLSLISCTNIIEDEIKPVEKTEVKSDKEDVQKNVEISGLLKLTGALPSEIVENLSLSGSYLSLPEFTGQARTAFPSIPSSGFTYEIKAVNTEDETDFYTGSPSADFSSYTITIPATSTEKEYKIHVSVRLSGFESEYIFLSGQSEEFPISLTSPVMTKDVTLKPLTGESGIMDLAVNVSGSGIRSAKATVNFSEYSHTYIQADMEDVILTFHTGTHTEDELEDGISSGAWPVTFDFYKSTDCTGEKAYSFTEVVNIFSNLATNTWVQNGSEPWFVTTTDGSGNKTTTCRITSAMVEGFKLTEIYVDPTATASTESGTFFNPCKTFSKAIEKLTDANKDYTIKIRGTLSGSGFQIPASLKNDGSGTYNAKSLTLCGATGLNSSGVPQDSLDGDDDGTVLHIFSDVPIVIKNLSIKNGSQDGQGMPAGIWMAGENLTLSDGAQLENNLAADHPGALNVDGIFKLKGSVYIPSGWNGETGYGRNDVYLPTGTTIKIAGKLTPPAACTNGIVATITPESYTAGTQLIELDTGVSDTNLAEAAAHFTVTPNPSNPDVEWKISSTGKLIAPLGSKEKPDAVGDIVFNDGSATPYSSTLTLTDEQKAAAIAIIFYKGTGLNSDDDTITIRTLGVGLKHNRIGLAWCLNSANAYSKKITTISCSRGGSAGALTFTGDKNGSDNLEQIAAYLKNNGSADDTSTTTNYPAFYFAKNYKEERIGSETVSRIIEGSEFETGWYLPSIAELFQIYACRADSINGFDIDSASNVLGGSRFGNSYYLSSSQYPSDDNSTYAFDVLFSSGDWFMSEKNDGSFFVCAIRAF